MSVKNLSITPKLDIEEIVFSARSEFQDILVVKTKQTGMTLVLDSVIQTTAADEFFYHEMMCHVPLCSHRSPSNVLILGGGDGGLLRQVLMHKRVKNIMLVEIDELVMDVSKKHLPQLNRAGAVFDDPRVNVVVQDAFKFVQYFNDFKFDIILVDSTDLNSVSNSLFSERFYARCRTILSKDGILVSQTGAPTLQNATFANTSFQLKKIFKNHGCFLTSVPSYMCGYFTFSWASDIQNLKLLSAESIKEIFDFESLQCVVYNPDLHKASFALPNWYLSLLNGPPEN